MTQRDFYDTEWAITAIQEAEAAGYTGWHACLSAAGWRTAGHLTIQQADHLLDDGSKAADWLKAQHEHPAVVLPGYMIPDGTPIWMQNRAPWA